MSRDNFDKPFYVDIGTSIAAVRLSATHDVVARFDHSWRGRAAIDEAKRLCDRLNAVVLPGNAAKLREALQTINNEALRSIWEGHWQGSITASENFKAFLDWLTVGDDAPCSALSAPPRNCDRFATKDQAWEAFCHTYFGPTDPGFIEDAFASWLFAPAAQEGGE